MSSPVKTEQAGTEKPKLGKKTFTGKVVSNKAEKTIVVVVETQRSDKRYNKIVKRRKKFMAHCEDTSCQEGDTVTIEECRPISKRKTFILKSIDRKAEVVK
jgi:small subunit ribosomal protein S17